MKKNIIKSIGLLVIIIIFIMLTIKFNIYSYDFIEGVIILFALICFIVIKKSKSLLDPVILFSIGWFGSMGISRLKLSLWQLKWKPITYIIFVVSAFSFYFGVFIIYNIIYNKHSKISRNIYINVDLSKIINIIFILGIVVFFIKIVRLGNIPMFSSNVVLARDQFVIPKLEIFIELLFLIPSFCIIDYKINKKHKIKYILFSLLSALLLSATLNRFYLINQISIFIVTYLLILNKYRKKISPKIVLIGLVVLIGIIYYMSYSSDIRFATYGKNYMVNRSAIKYDIGTNIPFFSQAYMYIAMNFDNMANIIQIGYKPEYFSFGLHSIPILSNSFLVDYAQSINVLSSNIPLINPSFNTFGYLLPYYLDFGFLGCLIFPFFIGLISGFIYYMEVYNDSPLWIMLYSIIAFGLIFIFFANWFTFKSGTATIILIIFTILVFKLSTSYKKNI